MHVLACFMLILSQLMLLVCYSLIYLQDGGRDHSFFNPKNVK